MAFAGRSLIAALGFLVCYAAFFTLIESRWMPDAENQSIANSMRVQEYAFERLGARVVLVGSSMMRRLPASELPAGWFNLSLGGMSSTDGLLIIDRLGARPDLIVIESNTVFMQPQFAWLDKQLTPGLLTVQWMVPAFRDANRPLSIALSYVRSTIRKTAQRLTAPSVGPALSAPEQAQRPTGAALAFLVAERQSPLSQHAQADIVAMLHPLLARLRAKGARIVFAEMPIGDALCDLPKVVSVREMVRARFADYPVLESVVCGKAATTDGIHLQGHAAAAVARAIVWQLAVSPQASASLQ